MRRCTVSSTYAFYVHIHPVIREAAPHTNLLLPHHVFKLIAQCRIGNGSFFINSSFHLHLNYREICNVCNLNEDNTLLHILTRCTLNTGPRNQFFADRVMPRSEIDLLFLLSPVTKSDVFSLYKFILQCLTNIHDLPSP